MPRSGRRIGSRSPGFWSRSAMACAPARPARRGRHGSPRRREKKNFPSFDIFQMERVSPSSTHALTL
ncbi:hypothetical protein BO1005MUT1_70012 [Hyphomicrobiales bacterium]|nr:hypothetical protein BO1005MUT1_70012 [Hyphomicrobiales bacterium]